MDGQNYLVFHTAADDSYMNSSANFKGADVTSNTTITLYFHGANGAESQDSIVLNFTAGKEVQVMEALGAALAGAKNPVTVVADDINSKYVDDNITSCGAISVNRGRYATVKSITGDTTLTLYFDSLRNHQGDEDQADEVTVSDEVTLTVDANKHETVMKALVQAINGKKSNPKSDGVLVVADDVVTNAANASVSAVYFHANVTACAAINVKAAHTGS